MKSILGGLTGTVRPWPILLENAAAEGSLAAGLAERSCQPCRSGTPPMSAGEISEFCRRVPKWIRLDRPSRIQRTYQFSDFREALIFAERAENLAQIEGHTPDLNFGWCIATVTLWTRQIDGLHENDFIMAAKLDVLAKAHGLG